MVILLLLSHGLDVDNNWRPDETVDFVLDMIGYGNQTRLCCISPACVD
jgi:hypothetical protein